MKVLKSIKKLQETANLYSLNKKTIGFIPTMGALHKGHLSLIQRARKENDIVIVSIFVNPKQFSNPDDLSRYPRTIDKDSSLIKEYADVLFCPDASEMYPSEFQTTVDVGKMGAIGEGAFRPGHFDGMATVVLKLFNIIKPTRAYVGKKDYQQYLVLQKMVNDLNLPIQVIGCETVREKSGLAMSSRNMRLSEKEKMGAAIIYKALREGKLKIEAGASAPDTRATIEDLLSTEPLWRTEYIEIRRIHDFEEIGTVDADVVMLIAGYLGEVRLIDSMEVRQQESVQ